MRLLGEAQLVRIFIGESDRWRGRPLYEAIVQEPRKDGLAGATVFRGIEGFGSHWRRHTSRILRLSEDLPVVIEIVDRSDRVATFLAKTDAMVSEGLITTERVNVVCYRDKASDHDPLDVELVS